MQQPVGAAAGLGTFLGQTISFLNPKVNNPYSGAMELWIPAERFRSDTLLEVVYIG